MSKPPRFLCVHQGHELYGSDQMFIRSVQAIRKSWPQAVITVHLPKMGTLGPFLKNLADHIICEDLLVLRRSELSWKNWRNLSSFLKAFTVAWKQCRKHDVIYINTITILSYLVSLFFMRKKFLLHAHESPPKDLRAVYSLCLKLCRMTLLANSAATRNNFLKSLISHVIFNGHGERDFVPAEKTLGQKQKLHLLLPGRFNAWKGQLLAIQAISEIRDDVTLTIVGSMYNQSGTYYAQMLKTIIDLNLSPFVEILPFSHRMADLYEKADIVLVPSTKPEPFGLVAVEAMFHGVPVIAANHGGLPEIVQHGKTGLLFEPGNIKQLANAIHYYQMHREQLCLHGQQGRAVYLDKFTSERYEQDFIEVVKEHVA